MSWKHLWLDNKMILARTPNLNGGLSLYSFSVDIRTWISLKLPLLLIFHMKQFMWVQRGKILKRRQYSTCESWRCKQYTVTFKIFKGYVNCLVSVRNAEILQSNWRSCLGHCWLNEMFSWGLFYSEHVWQFMWAVLNA